MRSYFSQFGDVNHVRLSRSKKTGRSKHYAFLEFASAEVAKIAAETMNNYLLFGHILKCSIVPKEQVHANLWKGADRRFKTVPWAKIEARKLDLPKGQSEWQKKVEKERKRRSAQAAKMKDIGYDFEPTELEEPVPVPKSKKKALEPKPEAKKAKKATKPKPAKEEKTIIVASTADDGVVVSEVVKKTTKTKESKKDAALEETVEDVVEETITVADTPAIEGTPSKRAKKPSKRALEAMEETASSKRVKKAKKVEK